MRDYSEGAETFSCDRCGRDGAVYFDGQNELCLDCLVNSHDDELFDYLKENDILRAWAEVSFERRGEEDG